MESCIHRIKTDMENIAKFTSTPQSGCTRFSYSSEDKQAREYLLKEITKLGLDVVIDGAGNIRAKYLTDNSDGPAVMFGSHIDTVANGGKFDGLTGVIAGLEAIRVIKENNVNLKNPLELIVFAEEEGSNFGITMFGSKILTGNYDAKDLRHIKNDEGISAYEIMKNFGLDIENIEDDVLKKGEIKAMIELHVEQGGVLDSKGIPIGIVECIVGMKTYKVGLRGVSNHAGTTPMYLRKDPMVGASEIIYYIEKVVKEDALSTTVATVGKINSKPNMPNVISEEVEFYVDIRDVNSKGIGMMVEKLTNKTKEIAEKRNLGYSIELIGESESVNLSPKVTNIIEKVAQDEGYKYRKMNSGAVHDAAMLTEWTDVGMIFVPSIDGKSHCPEEDTNYRDIKLGCDLLIHAILRLAGK